MKLFGWVVEHERSPDGRWDLTTHLTRPAGNPNLPHRKVVQQVHYRVRFGLMTIAANGSVKCHQFIVGSHSWTFGRMS